MDEKSNFYGLLTIVLAIAAMLAVRKFFPSLLTWILAAGVVLILWIIILVAVVLYFAFKKPKNNPEDSFAEERKAMVAKGRSHLMELRRLGLQVQNQDVRGINDQICASADKIFQTLRKRPEKIPEVRKFFNYYLPTQGCILEKYIREEKSGVPNETLTSDVIICLGDIKKAMDMQYNNLFEDDIIDFTVDMDAMTALCKQDGLISEGPDDKTETQINLKL